MVQSQFKIGHISESVGLAFEGFDFVVDAFDKPGRDPKKVSNFRLGNCMWQIKINS